jgi:hypothetical protein
MILRKVSTNLFLFRDLQYLRLLVFFSLPSLTLEPITLHEAFLSVVLCIAFQIGVQS